MEVFERNDTPGSHLDQAYQRECVVKLTQ